MQQPLAPSRIVEAVVGPFDDYCDGYGNPGSSEVGYVSGFKLSASSVAQNMDVNLEEIMSADRAEPSSASLDHVNAIRASSTSWLNGLIWGYDIARHDELITGPSIPLMKHEHRDGFSIPVFSATPLLEAGEALFGASRARRFPLMPGSHVLCAAKDVVANGPLEVWSAIALAIADDRNEHSSLFVEVAGHGAVGASRRAHEGLVSGFQRLENLLDDVTLCGDAQDVKFKEVFVGYTSQWVTEGRVCRALACVPYMMLARNAAPRPPLDLLSMSLSEWESFVSPHFMNRGPHK